jgi:hypothetical protein
MATLTGNQIDLTYQGLIKFIDNAAAATANKKRVTDGVGNNLPLIMSQEGIGFDGAVDFTDATITGLASGGVSVGSGTNSIQSVIGQAAIASAQSALAIGAGANATSGNAIAFGTEAGAAGSFSIAIGGYTEASGGYASAFGSGSNASGDFALALGKQSQASGTSSVAIGDGASASATNAISIGNTLTGDTDNAISIGKNIVNSGQGDSIIIGRDWNHTYGKDNVVIGNGQDKVTSVGQDNMILIGRVKKGDSNGGVAIGYGTEIYGSSGGRGIAIGYEAKAGVGTSADLCIAIGKGTEAKAVGSVALGADVTAETVNTTTVNLFQIAGYASMDYADDTAAATGGIPLGGVYHTAGALKIRIA